MPGGTTAYNIIQSVSIKITNSKGVIIGQIHGNAVDGTGEILKLEWTSANAIIGSIEDNNNANQSDIALGTYALNELLSYTIKLSNSQLTVSISNAKGVTKTLTSSYSAARWTTDSYYFKLGDYVQHRHQRRWWASVVLLIFDHARQLGARPSASRPGSCAVSSFTKWTLICP